MRSSLSPYDQMKKLSQSMSSSDTTAVPHHLLVRTDEFAPKVRKQVSIHTYPETQASYHRQQQRFYVACGTVLIAVIVIITIVIYAIIMTVNYQIKMAQSTSFTNHSR